MQHCVLSLDLGRKLGWAIAQHNAIDEWPEAVPGATGPFHGVGYGTRHLAGDPVTVELDQFLENVVATYGVTIISFERPLGHHKSQAQARLSAMLRGGIVAFCERHKPEPLRCLSEHPATIKKHFTGNGRATKDDMIDRCRQRGWRPETADEADALAMLDMTVVLLFVAKRNRRGAIVGLERVA